MATGSEKERNVLTILWRIENLSFFRTEFPLNGIRSSGFQPCVLENKLAFLALDLRGDEVSEGKASLSFYPDSSFLVDCEFSLLACDGYPLVTRQGIRTVISRVIQLKTAECPTQEELFVTKKTTFLPRDTLTVRCRVWKSDGNFPNAEYISVCSRIELVEISILRPIGRLSEFLLSQIDTFSVRLKSIHEWLLFDFKCSLIGDSLQNAKLGIELSTNTMRRKYLVKLEVSMLDNRQEVMKLGEKKKSFCASGTRQIWVVPKFGLRKNLREKMSLLNGKEGLNLFFRLTAVCDDISKFIEKTYIGTSNLEVFRASADLAFSETSFQTSDQNGNTPALLRNMATFSDASCQVSEQSDDIPGHLKPRTTCLSILAEDFFSLYRQQTFSDFELRCGGVSFPVHKNILCARSPVFSSMFSNKMVETTSLDIPDVASYALKRLLMFMYWGEVESGLTVERAANLYYAAVKYQVDSLRRMCSSILKSQISVANVSDILTLADRHQDSHLTSFVHNFILSHYDDVMYSDKWEKFLEINPVLAGKSAHLLYKRKASKEERDFPKRLKKS